MQYLGIDWGTRKAAWCASGDNGDVVEGAISADEDGLAKLVHRLGPDVRGCIEMMSGAVWVREIQPRPGAALRRQPYLLSMYTEPAFRGKGLATKIVETAIAWAKARGFPSMTLHASDLGRGVYEKLGFRMTTEMRLRFARR